MTIVEHVNRLENPVNRLGGWRLLFKHIYYAHIEHAKQ